MSSKDSAPQQRVIYINDPIKNHSQKHLHNSISTAKYSLITFLPRFFYEQFSKWANCFFLFTGSIQVIPGLSPTNPYGTLIPLSVVLFFSGIKEVVEDSKRHKQDAEVNKRTAKVLRGSTFELVEWRHIQVGDVIRLENGDFFPADLILISSSEPDGLCYIETSNLDGETNLKIRQGLPETSHIVTPEAMGQLQGVIKTELPNNSLYTFEGTIVVQDHEYPLSANQVLLRGAQLRNTRWSYGIVIYTGHETKLLKNATPTPIKRTRVDVMVNTQTLFLLSILVVISVSCSVGYLWRQMNAPFEYYILFQNNQSSSATVMFFRNLATYTILFNNLIPLSLMVTMDVTKYILGIFINNDLDMYHAVSDTTAKARSSTLVEELGLVDYIFSDKTGTLTCNIMKFQACVVDGLAYSYAIPEDKRYQVDDRGVGFGFRDFASFVEEWNARGSDSIFQEFLILMSVCHTVIPEVDDQGAILYQASSPDESALVNAAKDLGVVFHTRKPKSVTISVHGKDLEYQILNICEFNSTRKRMSCVVRDPFGKITIFVKGADTVILERLAPDQNRIVEATNNYLEDFATEGLRTLCLAYRHISEAEYEEWSRIFDAAACTINNRQLELDKAAERIEKDLILIGATAIEDKLQEGVPDTIATMMDAGIKVWVLTGDRQETAINIGYSCRLITADMNLIICNESNHADTKSFLEKTLLSVRGNMGMGTPKNNKKSFWGCCGKNKSQKRFRKDFQVDLAPMAIVIDGKSLGFALEEDIKYTFLELALVCKAVVCCRVSPLQKALVVKLVRENVQDSVTLAIGDGANDVSMIQVANVGVGISGMEGLQAARSADFSISQFRYLRKLLLVHGGWAYSRMSKIILYSFYKNITLYMIQLWFATQNGFSAQTLFETWAFVASYNVLWALLQPFAIGIFDQYVSARMLDRHAPLYRIGQSGTFYNHRVFWAWLINSFFQSALIFFSWSFIIGSSAVLLDGGTIDLWSWGIMVYATDLAVIMLKACLTVTSWSAPTYIAIFGGFALFFILVPPYTIVGANLKISPELFNVLGTSFSTPIFWLGLLLISITAVLRDFTWKYFKRNYHPMSYHIAQEIEKYNIPDYRPRQEWFKKAVHKVRAIQRLKRTRGFAFSQNETQGGQSNLIRIYDTTRRKPKG